MFETIGIWEIELIYAAVYDTYSILLTVLYVNTELSILYAILFKIKELNSIVCLRFISLNVLYFKESHTLIKDL